jgi:hypothetical protein
MKTFLLPDAGCLADLVRTPVAEATTANLLGDFQIVMARPFLAVHDHVSGARRLPHAPASRNQGSAVLSVRKFPFLEVSPWYSSPLPQNYDGYECLNPRSKRFSTP